MIPLLSRDAVRALDADAVERLGVPGLVLMENAGRGATDALCERFDERLERVVIVGGPGQNGGDGWVVARHLFNRGCWPRAILLGTEDRLKGDAAVNWAAMQRLGIAHDVLPDNDLSSLVSALDAATLVVDALFGTGLDRDVEGRYATAIELINAAAAPVVALDLPSGVHADRGAVLGVAVHAELTVTFAARKRGLYQHPGAGLAGDVVCASIGVPAPEQSEVGLIEDADVAQWVAQRKSDAHKGVAGHVLVLAGEQGRTGAALLSGTGALRTGAGLVTLAARGEGQRSLDTKVVELMTASLGDDDPVARALSLAQDKSAVVLGPGLGLDALGRELACRLAVELPRPAVLDADALTALGTDCARLRGVGHPRVLTPHPGEAARLLGSDTKDVQADRYAAAREIAQRSGAVTVLKGAGTVVAEPGGPARVCSAGTPAMAVAGTGDVLSGMIGALLSAGIAPWQAASAAVQLHARAGELAATGDRGMFASELAACVPEALCRCRAAVPQGAPDHDG